MSPRNNFPERKFLSLKERIAQAARWAKDSPGPETHISLKGGLHIWIAYKDGYTLRIGRQKVEPSAIEWRTVLNSWPWTTHAQATTSTQPPNWFYLSASIPDRLYQPELFAPTINAADANNAPHIS